MLRPRESRLQSLLKPQYLIPAVTAGLVTTAIINVTWNRITSFIRREIDESALSSPPEEAIEHFKGALLSALDEKFSEMTAPYNYNPDDRDELCAAGDKYQAMGEAAKADKAFEECAARTPQDTNIMEQIKVYKKLQDNEKDGVTELGKAENYEKVRDLLQKFIEGVLKGSIMVWEDNTMDDFREAYSEYESPEKVKQTLIALGDALMSQIKEQGNNNNVSPAKRCYELAGMDEDEIYLRLAKGAFGAGKISNASWFFETATEGQCVKGSKEMKAFARSIAQQYLLDKYPEGAEEVLSAAGMDEKEIAGILAESTLALPYEFIKEQSRGRIDSGAFLPDKYLDAKRLLKETGMPDKEIWKTLAVQAEKDGAFEAAAVLYEELKNTAKAQENYAKAAEGEEEKKDPEWHIDLLKKAGLKKEAQTATAEHKKTVIERAQKRIEEGDTKGAAWSYLSIGETAKAKKIVQDLVRKVEAEKDSMSDNDIEDIAGLCNTVRDMNTKNKLLKILTGRIMARGLEKPTDFFRLAELYREMGWNIVADYTSTMGLRKIGAENLKSVFSNNTDTSIDKAIETVTNAYFCECGTEPNPQATLTMIARRFFEAGNFSNAAIAFHVLGDDTGLNSSLQALEKKCKEYESPQCYMELAYTCKAIGEENLAKQYYTWAAQSYLEAEQYEYAATCYALAGEKNPPNNPALLACIQSAGEHFGDSNDYEAIHKEVHKCVDKLRDLVNLTEDTINLTQEEAEALLGRHAESEGLYREATVHYTDAGMLHDAGRVHADWASNLERDTDKTDYLHYYPDASGYYEDSGDLDGALRTSVKALAQARRGNYHSSEIRELTRILALLEAKASFYVQEFPSEE
jgi:tetratricopeptide (TPR) repeat protein